MQIKWIIILNKKKIKFNRGATSYTEQKWKHSNTIIYIWMQIKLIIILNKKINRGATSYTEQKWKRSTTIIYILW